MKGLMRSFLKKLCINREEVILAISEASKENTYVENVMGSIADSLHWNINKNYAETISIDFFRFARELIRKQRFGCVKLVADITEENFYGKTSSLYIHGWTGEKGIVGKFRFLVVAALFRNQMIPFYISILPVGAFKAEYLGKAIDYANSIGIKSSCLLLDRGFYSGDIIDTLQMQKMSYLIFVPKKPVFKHMLESLENNYTIEYEIKYSKNKSTYKAETNIVLIKNYNEYDWVFASNIFLQDARKYVSLYKKRWNIETMFRVQDEAKIKTKSINPVIRMFYFTISMLLVLTWNLYHKTEITFKGFVRENYKQLEENFRVSSF